MQTPFGVLCKIIQNNVIITAYKLLEQTMNRDYESRKSGAQGFASASTTPATDPTCRYLGDGVEV